LTAATEEVKCFKRYRAVNAGIGSRHPRGAHMARPKPQVRTIGQTIRLEPSLYDRVETFRFERRFTHMSDALRALIEAGLGYAEQRPELRGGRRESAWRPPADF
jgi:hypothetical protein